MAKTTGSSTTKHQYGEWVVETCEVGTPGFIVYKSHFQAGQDLSRGVSLATALKIVHCELYYDRLWRESDPRSTFQQAYRVRNIVTGQTINLP